MQGEEQVSAISAFSLSQIDILPVDVVKLRRATSLDPVLAKVVLFTQRGWPEDFEEGLKPYANRRCELSVESGCLMWGIRVVNLRPINKLCWGNCTPATQA